MAMFKMGRGKGGGRTMRQIATPEEGKNLLYAEEPSLQVTMEDVDVEPLKTDAYAGSPAYMALLNGLSKQSVAWAKKFIAKLDSREEIARLKPVEQNHPKHGGGRKGVLAALVARDIELDPMARAPVTKAAPTTEEGLGCDQCDFKAGSQEGLEAHITAVHDL